MPCYCSKSNDSVDVQKTGFQKWSVKLDYLSSIFNWYLIYYRANGNSVEMAGNARFRFEVVDNGQFQS